MSTRIYRTQRGWVIEQRDPSGGRVRDTYPTGQDALIALDPRNRPRKPAPARRPGTFIQQVDALIESFLRGLVTPSRTDSVRRSR